MPLGSNSRGIVVVVAVWVVGLRVVKVVGVKVGLVAIVGSSDSRSSSKSSNVSLARRVVSFFANLQSAFLTHTGDINHFQLKMRVFTFAKTTA